MNYDNYNGILKFDNVIFNQKNSKYKASISTTFKDGVLNCINIYFSNFSQFELVELISRRINEKMSKIEICYNNDNYEHHCIIGCDSFIFIEKLLNREIDFNYVTIGRINDSNSHDFENKVKSLFDL